MESRYWSMGSLVDDEIDDLGSCLSKEKISQPGRDISDCLV